MQQLNAGKTNRWRLGRQSLEDDMGWFIGEDLDGLRFTIRHESRQFDLSFSRQQWMTLGNEERDDEIDNALGQLTFEGRKNRTWSPYILLRKERGFDGSRPSENTWLGIQGIVRLNNHLQYWVNAAVRIGHEERNSGKRSLGGNALDAGITWSLQSRFEPSLTVGYARASGDSDVSDSGNDTFRQSGLHSDQFRLNGRNRFRYLGEVVAPELSNINMKRLEVQGLIGLYKPGSAFENAEDAPDPLRDIWLTRLEIEYEF